MIKVSIIGAGNVAQHLISAFEKSFDINVLQVFARNPSAISHLLPANKITSNYDELLEPDLFLIAVSDDAIAQVSARIPFINKLVAHTSGNFQMNDLNDKNRKAVFYPLQTFSKNKAIDFKEIPICLEAQSDKDYQFLEQIAQSISNKIYNVNSKQRQSLHVSAVFVNNFVNHLYAIGNQICEENKVNFEILKPLIQETANKILMLSPNEAQTGPAKRLDNETINEHLKLLTNENQKDIYKLITKSIIDNGKKL